MQKLETISETRAFLRPYRRAGRRVGLVPTMGALHEGHLSLIRRAKAECDLVVVSIFVNPTQFGPAEDFTAYPRPLEADLAACRTTGVDAAFCPSPAEMYDPAVATEVTVSRLTEGLCGAHRPGHFAGVTTVVAKLFNIVQPDAAYFGQKDAQQAVVIRKMVRDLDFPIDIVVCPTVRERDGLAMSSRNAYLSPEQRQQALSLSGALDWARDQIQDGQRGVPMLLEGMRARIEAAGPCTIDYIDVVDAEELTPLHQIEHKCLIALAVRIGQTRLIDNIVVET